MSVPGSNILNMALSVIAAQTVAYYQFLSRTQNTVGQYVPVFADPVNIKGSLQPMPRNLYERNGLDFQKTYVTFYASKEILDVERDVSGDQITFNGARYQVLSATDWTAIDGWTGVLCVRIGDA